MKLGKMYKQGTSRGVKRLKSQEEEGALERPQREPKSCLPDFRFRISILPVHIPLLNLIVIGVDVEVFLPS